MNIKKNLVTGSLWIGFSLVITSLLTYLFRYVLTKTLSIEEYGLYYAIVTVFLLAIMFVDFGISPAFVKYASEYIGKNRKKDIKLLILDYFKFKSKTGLIYIVLTVLSARILTKYYFRDESAFLLFIAISVVYLITTIFFNFLNSLFQAHQDGKNYALYEISKLIFQVIFLFIFIYFKMGIWSAVLSILIGPLMASLIFYYIYYTKYFPDFIKTRLEKNSELIRSVRSFAYANILFSIGGYILTYTDTYMLTYVTSLTEVGLYNVAVPTARLVMFFSGAVTIALMPLTSSLFAKKEFKLLRQLLNMIYKLSLLFFLPIGIVLVLYSDLVLKTIFSSEYLIAKTALQILTIGMLFNLFFTINTNILNGVGKPKINYSVTAIGAILNIILNAILIPNYGINGAAFATSLSYLMMCFLSFIYVNKNLKSMNFNLNNIFKILIISVVFTFSIEYLRKAIILQNPLLEGIVVVLISGIIYLLLAMILRIITIEGIKSIIDMYVKRKPSITEVSHEKD